MVEPLTKEGRQKWQEDFVKPILARKDPTVQGLCLGAVALHVRRCEQTTQDVEAQRDELARAILKCSPDIYRKAAAAFGCSEDMERAHQLALAAIGDGEVTSSREIIERLATICETFLAKLEPRHHRAAPICCVRSQYLNEFEAAIKEATS